jgi:hypothetical protein
MILQKQKFNDFKTQHHYVKSKLNQLKPGTMACAVILATKTVDIGCLQWQATPRGPCWISLASAPASPTWNLKG